MRLLFSRRWKKASQHFKLKIVSFVLGYLVCLSLTVFIWFYDFQSVKEGAQTTIHLAVADEVANVTGEYFSDCKVDLTSNDFVFFGFSSFPFCFRSLQLRSWPKTPG